MLGVGAIKTTSFMKQIGLDETGKPRSYSSLSFTTPRHNVEKHRVSPQLLTKVSVPHLGYNSDLATFSTYYIMSRNVFTLCPLCLGDLIFFTEM